MNFEPYKFASNNWSQEDYDNKIVYGEVAGILAKGTRDEELSTALPYVQNYRNAIDVGARYGCYTRSLHTAGFKHVYAFEVLEQFMPDFSRNVDLSRATVWCNGVMDKVGMYGRQGKRVLLEKGSTPICTIDYFDFQDVDLIKIDIDSYDHLALKGARNTIERCRPIIQMEWGPLQVKYNPTMQEDDAWSCIKDLGYIKAARAIGDNLILAPYELFC